MSVPRTTGRHRERFEAFSAGIPISILLGAIDHRRTLPGDGGRWYEANAVGVALGLPDGPFDAYAEPNEAGEYLPVNP